jgi:hypothetical protein
MWQRFGHALDPVQRTQPTPEGGAAGMWRDTLVRELDEDCLTFRFELKSPSHRLVNRACARRLRCFHQPPITSQSMASLQLHGSG